MLLYRMMKKTFNIKNYKTYTDTIHYILKIFMEITLKNVGCFPDSHHFIMHDIQNDFDHSHYLFHERGLLNKILLTHLALET